VAPPPKKKKLKSFDRREAYIANQGIRAVNAAREFNNTYGNANWAMSQPKEFYLNRDNLSKIKPALVNMKAGRDFYTTDKDDKRNMYMMAMNAIKGGGGAQMIDTSGLPAGARRTGRTLFQDPSKSQGFFGDLRTMAGDMIPGVTRKPNPAAVRAPLVNYFPNFGQEGKDFYKKEFPWSNAFSGIMKLGERFIPGANALKAILPKRKRKLIDRTLLPVNGIVPLLPEKSISEFEESIESTAGDGITTDRILDMATRSPEFTYPTDVATEVVTETDMPSDADLEEAYFYTFKDSGYSDAYVGNSAVIDTTMASLEQWKDAHKDNKAYIDSILQVKAAGEEMGIN